MREGCAGLNCGIKAVRLGTLRLLLACFRQCGESSRNQGPGWRKTCITWRAREYKF